MTKNRGFQDNTDQARGEPEFSAEKSSHPVIKSSESKSVGDSIQQQKASREPAHKENSNNNQRPQLRAEKQMPNSKPIRETAKFGRLKFRHLGILLSFLLCFGCPVVVSSIYLFERAADQYASNLGFSVRKEEQSSAIELLGGITELSGSSSSDTDILFAFLNSQELVNLIDQDVNLKNIWSKVDIQRDPIFAYDPNGTIEDLLAHWKRKVKIVYDSGTGMIDVRVLAFSPDDSFAITSALLEACSKMINDLSNSARLDAISYSRIELLDAEKRLREARKNLTLFRNRNQIVDPTIDTQAQMGLLNTLQQQLAETIIELDLLTPTTRDSDPRVKQAKNRKEVIESRIEIERSKLGLGGSGDNSEAFATLVGEYEGLIVEREFAEQSYTAALASFNSAQFSASRQSRYLAAHVNPTRAEKAEFPERIKILGLLSVFLFFFWAVLVLIFYSLRDRK